VDETGLDEVVLLELVGGAEEVGVQYPLVDELAD